MKRNAAAALGLFLFAIFTLTASAHTYSPDEESLIYVTQSFVRSGELNIPNPDSYPVVGGHRGVGGKLYSGTGPAQSLMAVPFYSLGTEVAKVFDFHFRDFILRVVMVTLFNSLITALTGILLLAWMRRLGFSTRVSAALVLVWGFGTLTWVYARSFYSEPLLTFFFVLAAYGLRAFNDTRRAAWIIVAGVAAGLATLTKVQGVLLLPALGLYFVLLEFKREPDLRAFVRRGLGPGVLLLAALGASLLLTGYLNFIRFEDPFQTGRGEVSQAMPILQGLYGLLLSSGKSVFLYAPPIILFFFALPRFARRFAPEAVFCVVLIATFVLFHARLEIWSGDGAWGPRYLVSTMPFWILPVGAAAGSWWRSAWRRAAVVALIAAGVAVNVLGLTINWDAYIQIQPNADARYFQPAESPLLAQWELLTERSGKWWDEVVASREGVVFVRGFLAGSGEENLPRFLAPRALILVKSGVAQPLHLSLLALDYRSDQKEKRRLAFWSNGAPLQSQLLPAADSGFLNYHVQIPAAEATWAPVDIVTLGSDAVGKSPQGDELGVHLQSLEVGASDTGRTLPLLNDLAIPPLPTADPKAMWAWFYEPANAQFDFFWWYLYFSGLGDWQAAAVSVAIAATGVLCFAAGAPTVWRTLRGTFT